MHEAQPNRRDVMVGAIALAAVAVPVAAMAQQKPPVLPRRGITYDTGTDFGYEGYLSRMSWHEDDVRREIAAIAEQLRCNTIQIAGTVHDRLRLAATIAQEHGLEIWLQPRLFEVGSDEQLAHVAQAVPIAAALADAGAKVVFSVGCETTLFQAGIVPGATFAERAVPLFSATPEQAQRITDDMNAYLARAIAAARAGFDGPLSYGAGAWERVDWSPFDIAGVNLYRDANNRAQYVEQLWAHMRHGKPLVITEFGCCTFEGAADYGPSGFMIVDYSSGLPRIPEGFVRSEEEQATELAELIQLYAAEGIEGAFVYNFLAQFDVHVPDDPRQDIDMASHAIVKSMPGAEDAPIVWEPKLAFHEVARLYAEL